MAFINCPMCKSSASDQAPFCPRCGHPLKKKETIFHEVVHTGSSSYGDDHLRMLLNQGWKIVEKSYEETPPDAEGYSCGIYKDKLER